MDERIERTRRLGTFLILVAFALWALDALAGTVRASLLGLLLVLVGTGLRVEAAIGQSGRRTSTRVE